MAELKTKKNKVSVENFLNRIKDEQKRKDSLIIIKIMQTISKSKPEMWGSSIIGFGNVHLKYESGRELDWFKIGFSPRKQSLTLYCMMGINNNSNLLKKLGKHKTGVGCLYIHKLEDVDVSVLKKLIEKGCRK